MGYVKKANNVKSYIIFRGNPASRPNLSGTRYLREHPKVSCFVIGSNELIEDTAKGTKIAIIAFVAIDIVKEFLADRFSLGSLGVNVASDVLQAAIGAGASIAAGAILVAIGAPAILTFGFAVIAGASVGYELADMDEEYKITDRARAYMMKLEQTKGTWLNRAEATLSHACDEAGSVNDSTDSGLGKVWTGQNVNAYLMTTF